MINKLKNPFFLRLFFLTKLPLALFGGLKLISITEESCVTSMPYKWLTKNPFKSMYFAAQSMAAEFSTALLAVQAIEQSKKNVALIIVDLKANFSKKATSTITFTCNDGLKYSKGVQQSLDSGEPVLVEGKTEGRDASGEVVSEFFFTWSFKERK